MQALSQADSSRILVVSDTHGHYPVFEAIVKEYGPLCDTLLFAGDGMWDLVITSYSIHYTKLYELIQASLFFQTAFAFIIGVYHAKIKHYGI